jgi:hypothetical protein
VLRFDPELHHLRRLIAAAREQHVPCVNCGDVYRRWSALTTDH